MSQPVFNKRQAMGLFDFYGQYSSKPLIVGIWPLVHQKTIEAIYSKRITGIVLNQKIYNEACLYCNDGVALEQWGLSEALELIEFVRASKRACGVYIVAPARNPLLLVNTLEKIL